MMISFWASITHPSVFNSFNPQNGPCCCKTRNGRTQLGIIGQMRWRVATGRVAAGDRSYTTVTKERSHSITDRDPSSLLTLSHTHTQSRTPDKLVLGISLTLPARRPHHSTDNARSWRAIGKTIVPLLGAKMLRCQRTFTVQRPRIFHPS